MTMRTATALALCLLASPAFALPALPHLPDLGGNSYTKNAPERYGVQTAPKRYARHGGKRDEIILFYTQAELLHDCKVKDLRSDQRIDSCTWIYPADIRLEGTCTIGIWDKWQNPRTPAAKGKLASILDHERAHCHGGWPKNHPNK